MDDPQREKDVLALCKIILGMSPEWYDNPNGAYENTCPMCGVMVKRGGGGEEYASMEEIPHDASCGYLIAKDLSTGLV